MSEKYIVAVDVGSQSAKMFIFNLRGEILAEGKESLRPNVLGEGGLVEHPEDDIWDATQMAAKQLMKNFTGNKEDIIGIGVGGIRCCRVLLKRDGTLAAPVISWMDARTARMYEDTDPEVGYVTSVSAYLTTRLTGELKDNIGNNYGKWPVDYETWNWSTDPAVIQKFQIPQEKLMEAVLPGSVIGHVTEQAAEATGFPVGVPVVCTTADKAVEGLGAGLIDDETAVVSLGTYITLMIQGHEMPLTDAQSYWGIMSSIPYRYIYECYGIRRGMWTVSWFRDLLGDGLIQQAEKEGTSPEEILNRGAEQVPAGCDGLMTVLDWLANPWEPFKRGVMIGFGAHMDERYMYRSILEGIAYTMKNNCDAMCKELGKDIHSLIISGGGSNSDLMMQIFADIFHLPTRRNVMNGSAAMGAAINAAVGVGAYSSYEEAVEHMVNVQDVFYPDPERAALYERLNREVYSKMTRYTDEVLKASYEVLKG